MTQSPKAALSRWDYSDAGRGVSPRTGGRSGPGLDDRRDRRGLQTPRRPDQRATRRGPRDHTTPPGDDRPGDRTTPWWSGNPRQHGGHRAHCDRARPVSIDAHGGRRSALRAGRCQRIRYVSDHREENTYPGPRPMRTVTRTVATSRSRSRYGVGPQHDECAITCDGGTVDGQSVRTRTRTQR